MSSVTPAATPAKQKIRSSLVRWRGNLDEDLLPLFRDFVDHTLSRLRGPFLAQHHPKQVLTYLEVAFKFALDRPSDDVKVEVRAGPSKGAIVLSAVRDQPFLVDTIRLFLRSAGADYWGGFNLVVTARRNAAGRLVGVGGEDGVQESLILLESDAGKLLVDTEASTNRLRQNLSLARVLTEDFRLMTRTVERFVEKLDVVAGRNPEEADGVRETAAFLSWLLKDNFVFMGASLVRGDDIGEPLGMQRLDTPYFHGPDGEWPQPHGLMVQVRKSDVESPVHRSGRIDEILVTVPGDDHRDDTRLFLRGMFTYRGVTQPSRNVPILRQVLAAILEAEEAGRGSFRYKGIANVFDSLPTEFLFTTSIKNIHDTVELVFEAEQQQDVGVTFMTSGSDNAFCLVAMPKTQYDDSLRRDLEARIVQRTGASYTSYGVFVGRFDTVLLHFYLTGAMRLGSDNLRSLTEDLRMIATPWLDRLWEALSEVHDEARADRLLDTYGRAFPESWIRATPAARTVRDIALLEGLGLRDPAIDVFEDHTGQLIMRIAQAHDIYLSDLLPVLDHFGLIVIDSFADEIGSRGGTLHMDTFRLQEPEGVDRAGFLRRSSLLVEAIEAVFRRDVDDNELNRLVLHGLHWREVDVLRGYLRYSRQLQMTLPFSRVVEILLAHPEIATHLIAFFHARFQPGHEDREAAIARTREQVVDDVRLIRAHDEDLLFSTLFELIDASLRTNFYRDDKVSHYLSFKFDCRMLRGLGKLRPKYEIFVHSRDVEGVHMRFGPVARGGLRWSDRLDYRTEVLGLATTQQSKNVVIVPEGSKGGFYLRNASRDPGLRRAEADKLYQTFIRGLLDITDNTVRGEPQHPPHVVCHDGFDPYLVVAADKGTAHLSDTANALSKAYGFWLGDAFASGGSNGYDHKGVAITARGAWVLVRRHFAELGKDPYTQPFDCVGIGDMGGDVFGNGLIETDQTRLLAAFNHLHIFLDPDPDVAASFAERKRLFEAGPRSGGWSHYDATKISEGGGVFDRSNKTIPLSPQAQEMLGLRVAEASPDLVIKHILLMEVDLLWNGGIGTYVKASTETQADADDRANDAVRINGDELRAKIVGEGGNLGFTQRGRIEAGLHGVALNMDAIDNSGGVDMSDHEVNLKILLDRIVERGDLTVEQRNDLLREMTDEVAELVLANNDAHGRQISRDRIRSQRDVYQFGRAIAFIERRFGLSRRTLNLPTEAVLSARAESGQGLTRTELAVISAWVKMFVYRELIAGNPKALPGYENLLLSYFPKAIQERYRDDVLKHMLADEIAMTMAVTRLVADSGAAFVPLMIETTGAAVPEIATALVRAHALAQTAQVRSTLEELRTSVSLADLYNAWVEVDAGAREVAAYWLSARGRVPTAEELDEMSAATDQVYELQTSDVMARNRDQAVAMLASDIPQAVAGHVLKAKYLSTAIMVWSDSKRSGQPIERAVIANVAVGRASRLRDIIEHLRATPASGQWEPIAKEILYIRYLQLLRSLTVRIPPDTKGATADELVPALAGGLLAGVRDQVDQIMGEGFIQPSIASLLVLEERVAAAISRMPAR